MRGPAWRFLEMIVRALLLGFWDYRTHGEERVPRRGGLILACTHQSHLDPPLVTAPLHRRVGYVARSTLFRNPLFARVIWWLGADAFDREGGGLEEMKAVMAELVAGRALIFFPEGTRTRDGKIGALKPGIALLARRSGVPVVPVAVEGTFRCWPRHRRIFRPGRVRIVYGEPVQYGVKQKKSEVLADLAERLSALQRQAASLA